MTKIVLPHHPNEIDGDGSGRSRIDKRSQRAVAEKFKDWLPSFRDLARS
jgi:hypothetical protein